MWHCKSFDELTTLELFRIYKIRTAVFVVEQNCAYPEVDDNDLRALHLFYQQGEEILAYARIIPAESAVHFGRVLVAQSARKGGFGRELVARILAKIERRYYGKPIHIQAQEYLQEFYASFGFKAVSGVYLEDGIPHLDMERK